MISLNGKRPTFLFNLEWLIKFLNNALIMNLFSRLQRFEKTTEMLTNCNQLSASRLRAASVEFKKHTQLLLDMKKDLNFIFKKIRAIKTKLR